MRCAELFNVTGQGAIVTRAGGGLGLAIEALAESRARVALLDIDEQRLAPEVGRLRGLRRTRGALGAAD